MARVDPYRGFRFLVEFDHAERGGFAKVKGIASESKFESYHEGGQNEFEHKLFSMATWGGLTLERGLADQSLWDWRADVIEGRIQRKMISIILKDEAGAEVKRWHAEHAGPTKWSLSDLDAASGQVAVESVEFAHHGLRAG